MLTDKLVFDDRMTLLLSKAVNSLAQQGIIAEMTSPKSISFSSTLPKPRVQEILESCGLPMQAKFSEAEHGCRGSAEVQGVPRADE